MLSIGVHGAAGRMGRALVRAIAEDPALSLAVAIDQPTSSLLGADAGELAGIARLGVGLRALSEGEGTLASAACQVLVDFSRSEATESLAAVALARGIPLVVGTTGMEAPALAALERASAAVPIVLAPNTSVGVTVLFHLAELATRLLGDGFDAEIVEMHHNKKADAPSGTALRLADVVLAAKGLDRSALRTGRDGKPGPRTRSEVGVLAMRGGDVIGDHTLVLAGEGERLELGHKATDRSLFARGALRAAKWVAGQQPGLYDMRDVLGLR